MENNFCVTNLGLNKDNYFRNEYYINAIISSEQFAVKNIEQYLRHVIDRKLVLSQAIYFEENQFYIKNRALKKYNISTKKVESYNDIVQYAQLDKHYVDDNFTYELVIFKCKNNKIYLYASFFHGIMDGIGGYTLLEELMKYIEGNIEEMVYDSSEGEIDDIIPRNNIKPPYYISGDFSKTIHKSLSYKYILDEKYTKKFESVMSKYHLSYIELTILLFIRLSYLFPNINLNTIDCILNLRDKKNQNILGMYANILPLEFDFNNELELASVARKIRTRMYQALKQRTFARYNFGETKSNCLISMIYNRLEEKDYTVEWINSDNIFYDYFITVMKGELISFHFQIDENLSFDINEFINNFCQLIDKMYFSPEAVVKLGEILLESEIKPRVPFNSVIEKEDLEKNLTKTLNSEDACQLIGDKKFTSADIRTFIFKNCDKLIGHRVICIKGGNAEEQILIALTALYIGVPYSIISEKAPKEYIDYLVDELNGTLFYVADFSFDKSNNLINKEIYFKTFPDIVCYFMTSGTTGFPKIIPVKAKSIANFINEDTSKFTKREAVNLLTTDLSFDLSLHSLFNTLCNGGKLVITNLNLIYKEQYIENLISKNNVTHVLATPSFLSLINYKKVPKETIFAAVGEVLPKRTAERVLNTGNKLYNVYGPTEATCYVSEVEINKNNIDNIPIGTSISGVGIYVIDSFGNFASENHAGEIVITGPTVFDGYINGDGKEFVIIDGNRYYRTGDIGYYKEETLYFLYRKDKQIKIDGYRIETEKIEEVVSKALSDSSFFLTVIENSLVLFHTSRFEDFEIQSMLQNSLPQYMIPRRFIYVNKIPLTKNYKVDLQKLKHIDQENRMLQLSGLELTEKSKEIMRVLLDTGIDLKNMGRFQIKDCGLSSMQIFGLQMDLSDLGYQISLEKLFSLTIIELLQMNTEMPENHRSFSYEFLSYYEPSTIQKKFIINYLKDKNSTIDNIGAVITFDDYDEALRTCEELKKLILRNINLHYFVSLKNGKPVMTLNTEFDFKIQKVNIRDKDSIELKDYITHFNLFLGPLCSIKLLSLKNHQIVLIEFHHVIVDGISLKELISSRGKSTPIIPYHNYNLILSDNDTKNGYEYFKQEVIPFLDVTFPSQNIELSSGRISINFEIVRDIAKAYSVSHEAVFATTYTAAMNKQDVIICTPVNLRKFPEDNYITGPLINLSSFRATFDGDFSVSFNNTNKSLKTSLKYSSLNLESIVEMGTLMNHLLTIFDSYDLDQDIKIDYELSNSLYDEKFKINTYVYKENNLYTIYMNSRYLTNDEIEQILNQLKSYIELAKKGI
ncbi:MULTISPECIES: AMP-binding protein [Streptococcus]|jgi:lichenysin synthetase A|uniref:AMP-binding protein n=1 Tax=Streptococcus TaxID=1301 RepID=UPI0003D30BF7|nr:MULTISPECIES: AMP-binding protein [Streptococcus]ETD07990.1 hypothetical protein HMPREF1196_01046 [Streptococcus sanguinis CC94A]